MSTSEPSDSLDPATTSSRPERGDAVEQPVEPTADGADVEQADDRTAEQDDVEQADDRSAEQDDGPVLPWSFGKDLGIEHKICGALIVVMMIYGLAMIPLRPVILGLAPIVLVTLTGSMTGLVMCGALGATGWPWWPAAIVLGSLSAIKFDLVLWWAGKLWGEQFIASIAGQTERARRRAKRAEALTRRYDVLALAVAHIPFVPVPRSIVCAVLGAAGMSFRRLVVIDLLFSVIVAVGFVALGWRIGEPAVAALEEFGKYMWYISIALLIGVFVFAFRNASKANAPS